MLAVRLDDGDAGILADPDAPGHILERGSTAPIGTVPLWGQTGNFGITVGSMAVRIGMSGMFGIGSSSLAWPGFSAHAVDVGRPFLSETGYRSFIGVHAELLPGLTPDTFTANVIASYVERQLRGRLRRIS